MTFILFLLLSIVIFGVMVILSVVRGISSFIFGRPSASQSRGSSYHSYSGKASDSDDTTNSASNKKIFSQDEGEYVRFEEIKD